VAVRSAGDFELAGTMTRQSLCMSYPARRPLRELALFATLLLCLFVLSGRQTASASPHNSASARTRPSSRFVFADFDGDNLPDLATVEIGQIGASHASYWIGFQMSAGGRQRIGLTAPVGGLEIASRDVNGDNRLDLIVTTTWLKNPVAVLLNDGHGNFTITDPAAWSASALSPKQIWVPPSLGVKDSPLAILSRPSQECAVGHCGAQHSIPPELATVVTPRQRVFTLAVSVLGRAPPPLLLHV
jgi:hypothetical protein